LNKREKGTGIAIESRSAHCQRRKSDLWTPYDSAQTASRRVATQSRASLRGVGRSTVFAFLAGLFEFGLSSLLGRAGSSFGWLRPCDSEKRRKSRTRGERGANSGKFDRDGRMGQRRANPRDTSRRRHVWSLIGPAFRDASPNCDRRHTRFTTGTRQ
jgi:hypothetical protein